MARVIAEAAVRLVADRKGLGSSIRREFREAIREATAGGSLFEGIDRDSETSARRVGSRWSQVLSGILSGLSGLLSGFAVTGKLLLLGTAAAGALAAVTSLAGGVGALGSALLTASGVAGLLPAALAGLVAIKGTLALGLSGISEGFAAVSGDAAEFNEAIKDLAPNAQSFLRAIREQKGAFDDLRLDVQNRLFAGLADAVAPLAERYFPLVKDLFGGIADSLNQAGREVADFATDADTVARTSGLFDNLRAAVANLAPAFKPALSALLDITNTGSEFLPGMTQQITELSTRFAEFIRGAADSGALTDFFQRAIDTVKQLGRIAGDVFATLGNVMDAAESQGGGLLNTVETITSALREWTGSLAGQEALSAFFESMRRVVSALAPPFLELVTIIARDFVPILADIASVIGPVLTPIIQVLGQLLQALRPLILAIANAFGTALAALGPFFEALADAVNDAMPTLGPIIEDIGEAFANLFEAMVPLAPLFVDLVEAALPLIPPLIQMVADLLPQFIEIVQALLPYIQQWFATMAEAIPVFTAVVSFLLSIFIPVLTVLAGAFTGLLYVAQLALQGIQALFTTIFPAIGSFLAGIWEDITSQVSAFWSTVSEFFSGGIADIAGRVRQLAIDLFNQFKTAMTNLGNAVASGLDAVVEFFKSLPGRVLSALGNVGSWLLDVGKNIIRGLIDGVKAMVRGVIDAVTGVISDAIGAAKSLLGIASPSKVFAEIGVQLGQGMIAGIAAITPAVADAASAMAGAATAGATANPLAVGTVAGVRSGVAGDGYTVVNQTNVMQPGTDVKQFADAVLGRGMAEVLSAASTLSVVRNGVQAGVNDQWVGAVG